MMLMMKEKTASGRSCYLLFPLLTVMVEGDVFKLCTYTYMRRNYTTIATVFGEA